MVEQSDASEITLPIWLSLVDKGKFSKKVVCVTTHLRVGGDNTGCLKTKPSLSVLVYALTKQRNLSFSVNS